MYQSIFTLLTCLFFVACGARTGILDDFEVDAAPDADDDSDVSGDFPCNYSPTGEFRRVAPDYSEVSIFPDIAWGDGHLAIAYSNLTEDEVLSPTVDVCRQEGTNSWDCERSESVTNVVNTTHITWGPGEFGVFWLENGSTTRLLRITPPDQFSVQELDSFPPVAECMGLIWADDTYFVSIADHMASQTPIRTYDINSMDLPSAVAETSPPFTYSYTIVSDGQTIVMSWIASTSAINFIRLPGNSFFQQETPPSTVAHAIAIRDGEIAVVWAEEDGASYQVLMHRLDLDWNTEEPERITSGSGSVRGIEIIAVEEGYLVAFNEFSGPLDNVQRVLVTPTRSHGDFEIEARQTIEIAAVNGEWFDPFSEMSNFPKPSLAYDGLDAYLATTVGDDLSLPEVRLQKISCHR